MTKYKIKAELRRSAMEDSHPYSVDDMAFDAVLYFQSGPVISLRSSDWRIFYLLVAEAL